MTDFERIKLYYDKKWATKDQLVKYVEFGKITKEEYETITGESFPIK